MTPTRRIAHSPMARLIAQLIQWIVRKLGLLIVIVAVLVIASVLRSEWQAHREAQAALGQQATGRIAAFQRELDAIDANIDAFETQAQASRGEYLDLAKQARAARRAAHRARARLDVLERNYWWWDDYVSPAKVAELKAARAAYAALDRSASAAEKARAQKSNAVAALRRQAEALESHRARILVQADDYEQRLATQRADTERNPRERMIATVKSKLPIAFVILAGILLLPAIIKTILYFGIAPLAGRLAPVRILPNAEPPPFPKPERSEVSAALEIAPGDELLVQPDYLQSSSQPAIKRTRWFLNPRLPFASLVSGMFALTSVRPEGETKTRAVVSSQRDPFSEIGVIEIPAGAAMVIQPRALAALVKPAGQPTHITRHWRLASLHAWITLQLRYLVFHGPCRLLLKGSRGVRAEAPLPGQPRLINQAGTLGFSANLDYRTIRCETFVPYLRGQEELFNDLFAGGPGWFIYEEMPSRDRRSGFAGRGLEGLFDGILKAFGI
jgi:hypothetical protein